MAELHAYSCDICAAPLTAGQDASSWVEVRGFPGATWRAVHLCSAACLRVWAQQRQGRRPVAGLLPAAGRR